MPTVPNIAEFAGCGTGTLTALWAITLIASATCVLLIYSIASFRNTEGGGHTSFVRHTAIEILWAMIPILILVSTATPSVKALITAEHNCRYSHSAIMN